MNIPIFTRKNNSLDLLFAGSITFHPTRIINQCCTARVIFENISNKFDLWYDYDKLGRTAGELNYDYY